MSQAESGQVSVAERYVAAALKACKLPEVVEAEEAVGGKRVRLVGSERDEASLAQAAGPGPTPSPRAGMADTARKT